MFKIAVSFQIQDPENKKRVCLGLLTHPHCLFFQFIHFYPINLHFHWQLGWVCLSYPAAFYLHINEQIERSTERILSFLIGLNARIGEGLLTIDRENELIWQNLYRIHIIPIGINLACGKMRRIGIQLQGMRIIGMNSLISHRIIVEMLHDVDFSTHRPGNISIR